ncbi:transcription initiation factor IIB family protein [Salinigranum marinum]|uniref:transcription initiation factor IIB n=1 Tax=Salinigranum marinum TaxID=1515595 RepID=UPI002989DFBF|nr:transcription initiation factor IIB family protein [Salinigranum marinum]
MNTDAILPALSDERTLFGDASSHDGCEIECPDCDESQPITDGHETYCPDCGLILEEAYLDCGPEWMPYDANEKRRVGSPVTPTRHDRGISAEIGWGRDGYGHELPSSKRHHLRRLRRWDRQARYDGKAAQNLAHGLSEIRRLGSVLELSESLREEASHLFRRAQSADLIVGRSIESMASAAVFAACRQRRLPRFLDEVAEVSYVDRGKVRLAYRALNRELKLQIPPPLPTDFLPRIASETAVSEPIQSRAHKLCSSPTVVAHTSGRNPSGVAAACLYQATRELNGYGSVRQSDLAAAARVTVVSLRSAWKTLEELDLPEGSVRSSNRLRTRSEVCRETRSNER